MNNTDIFRNKTTGRFLAGNNGGGRKKGARNRLGEAFVEALASDFDQHGEVVIKTVRAKSPEVYLKIIKDVLPREVLLRSFTVTASLDLSELEATKGRLAAYKYARDMIGAPLQVNRSTLMNRSTLRWAR